MFFCDECRVKNNWPESWFKSTGPCEVCGRTRVCNEIHSSQLPPVPTEEEEEEEAADGPIRA